jgi:hypothetical protein
MEQRLTRIGIDTHVAVVDRTSTEAALAVLIKDEISLSENHCMHVQRFKYCIHAGCTCVYRASRVYGSSHAAAIF